MESKHGRNWGVCTDGTLSLWRNPALGLCVIFQTESYRQLQGFAWQDSWEKLPSPHQTWCTASAWKFSEGVAFKNSALHSEASYWGPQVRYFSGNSTKITLLGASAEIFFSTWAQNFPFLALPHLPLFWLWVHKWSFVAGSSADSPLCLYCIHLTLSWYCSVRTNGTLGSQSLILPLACPVIVSE